MLCIYRDDNEYPRPDTRWVFTPLGYVCGLNILPVGMLLNKNLHPMGKRVLKLSGTIIRGTLKTPNSQLVTPISIKLQRPDGHD
jgi:hypothetical protein